MAWSGGVFTRTNGTYSGSGVWASDAAAAIKIQSSRHDTHDQDLAQGINACVAKDGSNTVTYLNLTGTVNSASGIVKVGSYVVLCTPGAMTNVFVGGNAGNFTGPGIENAGFGALALASLNGGTDNAAFGYFAMHACTTGTNNSAFGQGALQSLTTGSYNVGIGSGVDVPSATGSSQLSIQNAIYGTGNASAGSTISSGNIGLYTKTPTARLHLPAGTATAGTAPLKLTAGTNLGTPENGAIEFDGNAVYITIGGVRKTFTVT